MNILITGGTGSLGQALLKRFITPQCVVPDHNMNLVRPQRICVLSRGWAEQQKIKEMYGEDKRLRFFVGDVRDKERMNYALSNIDICIHAAAIKDLPTCEFNPFECLDTNVTGTRNVIEACINNRVHQAIFVSTDKAVYPINMYGTSKAMAEKLWLHGNKYAGSSPTLFQVVRYGNVMGSTGSVIPVWSRARQRGEPIEIRDIRMTRFFMLLSDAVATIWNAIYHRDQEVILPTNIKAVRIIDLAEALGCTEHKITKALPDEKIHELLDYRSSSELCPRLSVAEIRKILVKGGVVQCKNSQ